MKNILIMGGACIVADNLVYGHKEAVINHRFMIADLLNRKSLEAVFSKYDIDAVIHFAAFAYVGESVQKPMKYYENNVIGTLNLLETMQKYNVGKIVFSSTCATYRNGLKYIALRYFNAAGCSPDGDIGESHEPETHLIPLVLKAIKGEINHIKVFGKDYDTKDGTCIRDYIHVDDTAWHWKNWTNTAVASTLEPVSAPLSKIL